MIILVSYENSIFTHGKERTTYIMFGRHVYRTLNEKPTVNRCRDEQAPCGCTAKTRVFPIDGKNHKLQETVCNDGISDHNRQLPSGMICKQLYASKIFKVTFGFTEVTSHVKYRSGCELRCNERVTGKNCHIEPSVVSDI